MAFRYRGVRPAIATALAAVACAAPATVHAGSTDPVLVTQLSVCTITSLTITTAIPVSTMSTAPTSFALNAQGTCTGQPSGSLFLNGSGVTDGPATCAGFVSADGVGTISVGNGLGTMTFDVAGLTAAPLIAVTMSQMGLSGTGALALSPASMEACLLGGTTVLQYTGTSVFAL